MNLIKLFNFKYLRQNLKKSKGLILLLAVLVPLLTILMLISYNNTHYVYTISESELAVINIIGMYVIPVIISIILYGYVYKRNSVDFINSMPINRTSIYITNFIAGIFIMLFLQILVLIVTLVCNSVMANIFLPITVILDIFIVMLVSYIFVFSASSLAMTVSGNIQTQIVVTMLIIFLIPFSTMALANFNASKYAQININGEIKQVEQITMQDYTTPFKMITSVVFGNLTVFYSVNSITKTIILSILYFILGIYMFNRRKMECVENSFDNAIVHLVVKGITLVPMVFIMLTMTLNVNSFVILLTLIFVYYIVYDFITHKKIKFKYTVVGFIISYLILFGIYEGGRFLNDNIKTTIDINDISKMGVELKLIGSNSIYNNKELDVYIEDKELIKELFMNVYSEKLLEEKNTVVSENVDIDGNYEERYSYRDVKIKLQNGREIYLNAIINYNTYEKIAKKLLTEEEYKKQYRELLKIEDGIIIYEGQFLDQTITEQIINIINNYELEKFINLDRNNLTPYNYRLERYSSSRPYMSLYQYKDHEYRKYEIEKTIDIELFSLITQALNNKTIEALLNPDIDMFKPNVEIIESTVIDTSDSFDYGDITSSYEFIEYFKAHQNDICDMNKPYHVFRISNATAYKNLYMYCNETEELDNIILKNITKKVDFTEIKQ